MEGELWERMYQLLQRLGNQYARKGVVFSDKWIVAIYLWAVVHDRPVCWAADRRNWPASLVAALPSPSTLSRRLKTPSVRALQARLEQLAAAQLPTGLYKWIDAKPLPIGRCSKDRQAGYGPCAGGMAKGYKLFALCDSHGRLEAWRVGPMNADEKIMSCRLLAHIQATGYLTGDSNYDASRVYATAGSAGLVLVADKRGGAGLGHRPQRPERLRSIDLQRRPFGQALLMQRNGIERIFGHLTCAAAALQPLPAWVRTHHRVELWVRGKIIIYYLRRTMKLTLTA